MKKLLLIFSFVVCSIVSNAQTLYVPSGTSGIGTSTVAGNVGIGIAQPGYTLDVNGPLNNFKARFQGPDGYITMGPANSGWAHIYTDRPNFIFNQNVWSIPGGFSSYSSADLTLQTNGTTRMTVSNSNGYVGIGVNPPQEALHVNGNIRGNVSGAVRISTGSGFVDIGPMNTSWSHFQTDRASFYFNKPIHVDGSISSYGSNDLNLQTGGTTRMTVSNSSGNVAIGTNPTPEKLTVQGNVQIPLSNALGYLVSTDKLIHNGNNVGNYSLGWFWDSWQTGAPTGYLSSAGGLKFFTGSAQRVAIDATGNMGIGTITAPEKLTVQGNIQVPLSNTLGYLVSTDKFTHNGNNVGSYSLGWFWDSWQAGAPTSYLSSAGGMKFFTGSNLRVAIDAFGNVGIGTGDATLDAKLAVKGQVHSQEVKVDLVGSVAPDYVFEKDYELSSLKEIKSYIDQNKHLPEIPSAKEIEKNGLQLGEMNLLLLKKIEELTLHLIQVNERLENLEKENSELKKKTN